MHRERGPRSSSWAVETGDLGQRRRALLCTVRFSEIKYPDARLLQCAVPGLARNTVYISSDVLKSPPPTPKPHCRGSPLVALGLEPEILRHRESESGLRS